MSLVAPNPFSSGGTSIANECINANGFLRSKGLTFPRDNIREIIFAAGKLGCCHFIDLNPNNQAPPGYDPSFLLDTKKRSLEASALSYQLSMLEKKINSYDIPLPPAFLTPSDLPSIDPLSSVQMALQPLQESLQSNTNFKNNIEISLNSIKEQLHILELVSPSVQQDVGTPLLGGESQLLRYFCGIINRSRMPSFERLLFRLSRGKAIVRQAPVHEELLHEGKLVSKTVFCVYFLGQILEQKLLKLMSGLGAQIYEIPDTLSEIERRKRELFSQKMQAEQVLAVTVGSIKDTLYKLANDGDKSPLRIWQREVKCESVIQDTARRMVAGRDYVQAHCWVTKDQGPLLFDELNYLSSRSGHGGVGMWKQDTDEMPPTYFPSTKFTSVFQAVTNTYGVPRYGEVNPALYFIITFPFQFGVMFGDAGHGTLLFLFALWLLYKEKDHEEQARAGKIDEIVGMIHGGRYLILLMSCFSIFCGFIYNDFFSISLNLWGTGYTVTEDEVFRNVSFVGPVYPFGLDPVWHLKANGLVFYNSFKMKMSVIVGVTQMVFGILISLANHLHFKKTKNAIFDFIPQMTFMLSFFGYMIFMIIYKWCVDWDPIMAQHITPTNLIQTLLFMVLKPGTLDYEMYPGMTAIQVILVLVAVLSIPFMFLAIPLIDYFQHKSANRAGGHHEEESLLRESKSAADKEYSFGQEFVSHAIHEIEFILGAISNTASYLRLWALSLAHAALSEVFWDKLLISTLNSGNPFMVVVGFAIWVFATGMMDSLECFLHALRLHWVEWENKFYNGDGYLFQPCSFSESLEAAAYNQK